MIRIKYFIITVLICLLGNSLIFSHLAIANDMTGGIGETPTTSERVDRELDKFMDYNPQNMLNTLEENTDFKTFQGKSNKNAVLSPGVDSISGIIYTIIDIIKYLLGTLAVISLILAIIKMISSGSDASEEEFAKVKTNFLYAIIAVIVAISADFVFTNVLVVGSNNFLSSTTAASSFAAVGTGEIQGIYNLLQAVIGSVSVLMLVIAGIRLMVSTGDESGYATVKNQILYGSAGIILVALSEFVVKEIVFKNAGTGFDAQNLGQLIVSFTNFFAATISLIAFLSLIYAGYLYVVSGVMEDNSDKVKAIVIGSIIGIIIAASSFALVNTVIKLDSEPISYYEIEYKSHLKLYC